MIRLFRLFLLPGFLLVIPATWGADAPSAPIVQMAPYNVKAGPLGYIGIRCSLDVGFLGLVSGNARIKSMVVSEVFKDSAAERAGIRVQDEVLSLDGVAITDFTINGIKEYGTKEKGDYVTLAIRTPGAPQRKLTFPLGPRPAPAK